MLKRLEKAFFKRPTLEVCRDILGKYLVHNLPAGRHGIGKKKIIGKIVEVEAYVGTNDKASHALGGKITERNRAEFLEGGHVYIYLVYGMYWQFNISTGRKGFPECFLIRALEPTERRNRETEKHRNKRTEKQSNLTNGPGKLCRWMKLNKKHYGIDLTKSRELWIEDASFPRDFHYSASVRLRKPSVAYEAEQARNRARRWSRLPDSQIVRARRIGIDYAGKYWAGRLWRFYIKGNSCVSKF